MKRAFQRIVAIAAVVAFLPVMAAAKPRHWYTDKRWWLGEAVIVAANVLDVQSSCRAFDHGFAEGNFPLRGTRSCAKLAGLGTAGFGISTALHALAWHCSESSFHPIRCYGMNNNELDHQEAWQAVELITIPAISAIGHGTAALHNYRLPIRPLANVGRTGQNNEHRATSPQN